MYARSESANGDSELGEMVLLHLEDVAGERRVADELHVWRRLKER